MIDCGGLEFRLANETLSALVSVTNGGEVNLVSPVVNDESFIGLHEVTFDVYLVDLDPEAQVMLWTLDFSLPIYVEPLPIEDDLGAEIIGSLLREAPIATDPIAPSYSAFLGEEVILEFNFVDPLVLQEESSTSQGEGNEEEPQELGAEGL